MERIKNRALMAIIKLIILRYQNQHRGNLDEKIFVLFEAAKRIFSAKTDKNLGDAIVDANADASDI